jgi:hypothetical protein
MGLLVATMLAAAALPAYAQGFGERAVARVSVVVPFTVTRVSETVFETLPLPEAAAPTGGLGAVCLVGSPFAGTQVRLNAAPTDRQADARAGAMPTVQSVPIDGESIRCRSGHGLSLSLTDDAGNPVDVDSGVVVITFGPE